MDEEEVDVRVALGYAGKFGDGEGVAGYVDSVAAVESRVGGG